MDSITALQAERRNLTLQANQIARDTTLPVAQVRANLDAIEAEIRDVDTRMDAAKAGPDPSTFGNLHPSTHRGSSSHPAVGQAPRLELPEKGYELLFDAATSRKPFTLSVSDIKNLVDSDDAPQSQIPHYTLPPVPFSREGTRIIDLVPTSMTEAAKETFYRTTTAATAASVVVEGGTKPQSNLVFEPVDAHVRKIAHWIEVTDEALNDYRAFQSVVASEMTAGVIAAENHQLLLGTGVAPDIEGLLAASLTGVLSDTVGGGTRLDAIAEAITALRTGSSFVEPDAIVMHPADYLQTILEKDQQDRYMAEDPLRSPSRVLWGVPVTLTTDITEGTAIIANFAEATRAWIREGIRLEVNPWAETQFKSNKVLILCEERLAFGCVKPSAIFRLTGL